VASRPGNPSRRAFLTVLASGAVLAACGDWRAGSEAPRLGLALGGGGARGLAHIPFLEMLDELEVRPHRIAGTSIGAVFGTLYAAGHSGREIRALMTGLVGDGREEGMFNGNRFRWLEYIDLALGDGGLLDTADFLEFLHGALGRDTFRELEIPTRVVATDLWRRQAVVFDSGPLVPAVKASIALPGIFQPVVLDGRVLVDGGLVNPVPWNLLDDCDVVVALDVMGDRTREDDEVPGVLDSVFLSFQATQEALVEERLRLAPPDLYIRPPIRDIRVLDFHRAGDIYDQAKPALEELRWGLKRLLG
jgi:NTE family protein